MIDYVRVDSLLLWFVLFPLQPAVQTNSAVIGAIFEEYLVSCPKCHDNMFSILLFEPLISDSLQLSVGQGRLTEGEGRKGGGGTAGRGCMEEYTMYIIQCILYMWAPLILILYIYIFIKNCRKSVT